MADKAFLSGINDYKTIGDLRGCVNDTASLRQLLMDEFGFTDKQIRVRTDEGVTKSELDKGWKWLLKDAKSGDRLIFHFSGHGSQTIDLDSDEEADTADELLCLYGMDWHDPKTYMLDDELREWTTQIPEGVAVTFILDCCHSGTGTRAIEPDLVRAAKSNLRSAASLSLDDIATQRTSNAAAARAETFQQASRSGLRPSVASNINENSVLARYVHPPLEVQIAIDKANRKSSIRGALSATRSRSGDGGNMNHVLWSGCRDDQTSADAYISNDYHGAFTYYFCDSVRNEGASASSTKVVQRLRQSLQNERFDQVPQLEPTNTDGTVFGPQSDSGPVIPDPFDDLGNTGPTTNQWQALLAVLQEIAASLAAAARVSGQTRSGGRSLVYVHGICQHDEGYSDGWWSSMAPHLPPALRNVFSSERHEVLWSEHVTQVDRDVAASVDPAEQQQMEMMLREILQERITREVGEQIVERSQAMGPAGTRGGVRSIEPEGAVPRAMFGIPGLDCVDDFVKYLTIDSVRRAVIGEFTDKVEPLLRRGDSVEVISHSWGTVVAYEALRSLERSGLSGRVHNWFTVGAALSISFVARRLRPSDGQKPTLVDHWINLDARGDGVGGSLRATGLRVDEEYLRLPPVGCSSFFGLVSPACAHSSYFVAANRTVNRDIFSESIERS